MAPTLSVDSCLWRRLACLKARGWPTQPQAAPRQLRRLGRPREGCWRAGSKGLSPLLHQALNYLESQSHKLDATLQQAETLLGGQQAMQRAWLREHGGMRMQY